MKNKEVLEQYLEENESLCPEIVKLFHVFIYMAGDYLTMLENYDEELEEIDEYISNRESVNINITIDLVYKYLQSISKEYADLFVRLLDNGTFELFLKEDDLIERPSDPITTPKPNSTIYIPVENTIEDGAVIVHELFHYLNDTESLVVVKDIFTEMISIYNEFRYYQFINKLGYNNINFYKEVCSRINNSSIAALDLCYSASIFDIYNNTGNITKKNIEFIDKYREIYEENKYDLINYYEDKDFPYNISQFRIDLSYVLGTLIAFYSLKEPKLFDIKMEYINKNVNTLTIKQVLDVLDTKIDDYPLWIVDTQNMLEKALGEINDENYMYSRSHGNRKN